MTPKPHLPGTPRPRPAEPRFDWLGFFAAPLKSRGRFSPRLLMAWQAFYLLCWLVRRWITTEPHVLNGVLVPVPAIEGVLGILAGLVAALLSLGTFQKIKLGDAAPAPGEIEAEANAAP